MKKYLTNIIIVLFMITLFFSFGGIKLMAEETSIHYIVTTPGEDTAHEITINWQCFKEGSYALLTKQSDTNFEDAIKYEPNTYLWSTQGINNTETNTTFYTKERYVCNVELTNLEEKTKYMYKIVSGDEESNIYYFQTSGLTNNWNFIAFVDFQTRENTIMHPLINKIYDIAGNPSLCLCSGDMVDTAGEEFEWEWVLDNEVFTKFTYAACPGDHEYWASSTGSTYPQYDKPYTYNALFDFPKNGCEVALNSNYYFYYNNVLFVMLDMSDSDTSSGTKFTKQVSWFKETIASLKGTYQYLVVFDHKSIYSAYSNDSNVAKKLRPQWYPVFDEFNVDLVISGHDHMYSRTYQLYNNKVSKKELVGTYYLDMGSSANKRRALESAIAKDGLHEKVIDIATLEYSFGANIEVTEEKMTVSVINQDGITCDYFEIKSKRDVLDITIDEQKKEDYENLATLTLTNKTSNTGELTINESEKTKYIESFKLMNGEKVLLDEKYNFNDPSKVYKVNNLDSDNYTLIYTLVDKSTISIDVEISYGKLGELYLDYENKSFSLNWNNSLVTNKKMVYELYIDENLAKTLDQSEIENKKYVFNNNYLIGNHSLELVIKKEDGSIYDSYNLTYYGLDEPSINQTELNLNVGDKIPLDIDFYLMELITIKSDNNSVACYEDGNIRALSAGCAKITVSIASSDYHYDINVNVNKVSEKSGCQSALAVISSLFFSISTLAMFKFVLKKKHE